MLNSYNFIFFLIFKKKKKKKHWVGMLQFPIVVDRFSLKDRKPPFFCDNFSEMQYPITGCEFLADIFLALQDIALL